MLKEEIEAGRKAFEKYGVPADRIFDEIMRARFLDYQLFLNPTNKEYGISIEDLYKNMKKTIPVFGEYHGDADTYVKAYTLAMAIDPMAYAPGVEPLNREEEALMVSVIKKAEAAGKTVLFAGADSYLPAMQMIFEQLKTKRIAAAFANPEWKNKIQYAFPRGRAMTMDELSSDKEHYDFIFDWEPERFSRISLLRKLLADKGSVFMAIPHKILTNKDEKENQEREKTADDKVLQAFNDGLLHGKEFAFLTIMEKPVSAVHFGEAALSEGKWKSYPLFTLSADDFKAAHDWDFNTYAFNGNAALQSFMEQGLLKTDLLVGDAFTIVPSQRLKKGIYRYAANRKALAASGLRNDLLKTAAADDGTKAVLAQDGDLILSTSGEEVIMTVVTGKPVIVSDPSMAVFHPKGQYTSMYLKIFLDCPIGQLFLDSLKAGEKIRLIAERILRFPLPEADAVQIDTITKEGEESIKAVSEAENQYRNLQKDSIRSLLMKN